MITDDYNGTALSDEITEDRLKRLLGWLNPDPHVSADKLLSIKKKLIKIFICRGSNTPEDLADRTIDRVARKIETIQATYVGDPAQYFCGVAVNILHESMRRERIPAVLPPAPVPSDKNKEWDYDCLERCMKQLSEYDRNLVLSYYQLEKHAKIDHRRNLAEELGLGVNALRIRACRIRATLQQCLEHMKANTSDSHII